MKLQGLKMNCFGDSITFGAGATDPVALGYVGLLRSEYGIDARNYGIGGARIAEQIVKRANVLYDYIDFCLRADHMNPDAEVVFVLGGTNDFGHGDAPFGTMDDRTTRTFCGACHVMMEKLTKNFPTAKIVIGLPLRRQNETTPRSNGEGGTVVLMDYIHVIKETAKRFGLYVLDLHDECPSETFAPLYSCDLLLDGLHPSNAGHAMLAKRIASYIETL